MVQVGSQKTIEYPLCPWNRSAHIYWGLRMVMVTMPQEDSNKKQDKKPQYGNKYQGNGSFLGFIKEGPLAGMEIKLSKPLAGQHLEFMEATVAHCSNNDWTYIYKILLDFSMMDNPDPSEWTTTKLVPKVDKDCKLVFVDGLQVIMEIEVVYKFIEKMTMSYM